MSEYKQQLQDISQIRSMMEESTRFMSLSGLSGVGAGLVALVGAAGSYWYLEDEGIYAELGRRTFLPTFGQLGTLLLIACLILLAAVGIATFFTMRHTRRQGQALWTKASRRMAWNLFLPLSVGAIFCVELAMKGVGGMVAPATLIFYGVALFNAGKYTLGEIRYLGISEMVLGLVAAAFPGLGIFFWAIGFGLLHIVYGIVMYLKYER
jgi:hypothetical protein